MLEFTKMHPDVKAAIRLQELDNQLAELRREAAAFPKHIAQVATEHASSMGRLEMDEAALLANRKERKRLESEIQAQNPKISKLRDQMLAAKNDEQYRAFQNGIESSETGIRKLEDRILELMAESEPLEKSVKAAERALADITKQVESEEAHAREKTAADVKTIAELQDRRKKLAAEISPTVLKEYEYLRKSRRGIAVAEVNDGRCAACHIGLRPQFAQELRSSDKVIYCEGCGRILIDDPQAKDAAYDFRITFDSALSPHQVTQTLEALADYYRACGGAGLQVDFDVEEVLISELVHA